MRTERECGIEYKIDEINYSDIGFVTKWRIKLFYHLFMKANSVDNHFYSYRNIFNHTKIIEVCIKKKGLVKL